MTRFPLLLLLLCAVGCSGDYIRLGNASTLAIDPSATPEQVELVAAAADAWNQATGGRVRLQLRMGQLDGDASIRFEPLGFPHVGVTNMSVHRAPAISIDTVLTDDSCRKKTIMHEFGHAFGLEDHEVGTLMESGCAVPAVVDARTLQRWEELQEQEIRDALKGME